MPRQPTVTESVQKMLMDHGFLRECEETRKGIWGEETRRAYNDAIWKVAYPSGTWTWDQCKVAEVSQPETVPKDLELAMEEGKGIQ